MLFMMKINLITIEYRVMMRVTKIEQIGSQLCAKDERDWIIYICYIYLFQSKICISAIEKGLTKE